LNALDANTVCMLVEGEHGLSFGLQLIRASYDALLVVLYVLMICPVICAIQCKDACMRFKQHLIMFPVPEPWELHKTTAKFSTHNVEKSLLDLQLSGIGPAETLAEFGIPVLADLPVGEDAHVRSACMFSCISELFHLKPS
jgi:hypothetical protein